MGQMSGTSGCKIIVANFPPQKTLKELLEEFSVFVLPRVQAGVSPSSGQACLSP